MGENVHGLVDHLFRHESGRMVAALVRSLGPGQMDLAEEVVQDALLQALRKWPFSGVPEKPGAWLYRVARNLALDRLRRSANFRGKGDDVRRSMAAVTVPEETALPGELTDDQLRLVFLCCHPEVPRDSRVALTLKTVGGFSVDEIARGFLARKTTIAQRLVRAQRRIRERRLPFEVPPPDELPERLDTVLEVLYLMFNEGYAAHDGDVLVRSDLCDEARRLVGELARLPLTRRPEVHALAALLAFQASRFAARVDDNGELVLLDEQDRNLWDRAAVAEGFQQLGESAAGTRRTTYHVEAAIAACHASAPNSAATDWGAILRFYDQLLRINPSPVVRLNRAVAVSRLHGPEVGLEALADLDGGALMDYHLFHATRGELLRRAGESQAAAAAYARALECSCSGPERRFLAHRLAMVQEPS